MKKKFFVFSILALLAFENIAAQSNRLFTADNDLSSSFIHEVYADSQNIIWIATEDGLNRYDGAKFTIFKNRENDSLSLPHNYVRTIFESKDKQLFFGLFNGLALYERGSHTFQKIPLILENQNEYPSHVTAMAELENGKIIIGTAGQGLFDYNPEDKTGHASYLNKVVERNFIEHLYQDNLGNLWIATTQSELIKLTNPQNPSAGKIVHYGINGSNISEDKQGNIYIGNLDSGLYTIKKGMDKAQKIQSGDSPNTDLIRTIYHNDDKLLIGTDGHGLSVYNIAEEKFSQVDFNVTSFDFSKSKIHSVTKDESGNLWLGVYQKGLLQIPSKTNSFNYLGFKSLKNNVIGSNAVMSLYKTEDGTLLVGTDGDGLYGIDPKGRQRFHWDKEDNFPPTLMSLFQDSEKQIWLGSFLNNFGRVDLENGRFNEFVLKDENGEKVQNVFSITEDDHKTLWVGTMGSGLFSIDLKTNEVERFFGVQNPDYSRPPNFLHNVWINTVYAGEDDKLWMGTFDGLGTYDVAENSFINSLGTNRLLGGIIIYAISEKGDYLWLGTSEGLIKYNKQSHEYKKFNTTDGLPNDVVVGITGDAENNLWISTYHGISKFNPETENFINYFYNDGLQGNEFSKNAVFSNQKNEIYFGGIHGVNYFNPIKIKDKSATPEVRLTGFYIQNENVKKGTKSGDYEIIDKPIVNAEEFNLSIEDNSFSMEFATLDFDNPSHITYAYSMDGGDWISLQQGVNTVAFNNLKPGTYNFKVRAKDYTNFSEPEEITIVIHPAWYFSNAAITVYTILLLAGISIIIVFVRQRRKTRQELREHVRNEQINDAKLQLYSNISHEIRTPITLILNPLKKLLESGADSDKQKLYGIMKRNSERILHLINQLMDVSKISKGEIDLNFRKKDIISYIKETCLIFEDQIHSKDIDFRILHEPDSLYVSIDPKFFDKIIQNIVSNAIKFTAAGGKITLIIKSVVENEKDFCEIRVIDNGIGIENAHINRIFDRFHQIPEDSETQKTGTGIGLHLSKSIVDLHDGKIWAANNENKKGSCFTIRIPKNQPEPITEPVAEKTDEQLSTTEEDMFAASETMAEEDTFTRDSKKYKILLVDDDHELRSYIKGELSSKFRILECSNGKKALPIVLKEKPDLILSDLVMPEMDGLVFSRKVKQNLNTNHIPVILLTAKSSDKSNLEGLKTGADAYINKPFNIQILEKTILNIIRNREVLKNNFSGNQQHPDKVKQVKLKSADEKLIERIIHVINENINNPELNVEMIADKIGISRVHLYRKLKKLTSQSARDFIKNIRLKQAARLLASKEYQISDVAYATGFSNSSTFSRNFKELYGLSPKEFMNSEKEKQQEILG